jgi:hypothetical protein
MRSIVPKELRDLPDGRRSFVSLKRPCFCWVGSLPEFTLTPVEGVERTG